jgi:predicted transcriptional regulator
MPASITLQIDENLRDRLESLAEDSRKPSGVLAEEALRSYVDTRSWEIAKLKRAIREADELGTVPDEEVEAWMLSWGTEHELPMPTPRRSPVE